MSHAVLRRHLPLFHAEWIHGYPQGKLTSSFWQVSLGYFPRLEFPWPWDILPTHQNCSHSFAELYFPSLFLIPPCLFHFFMNCQLLWVCVRYPFLTFAFSAPNIENLLSISDPSVSTLSSLKYLSSKKKIYVYFKLAVITKIFNRSENVQDESIRVGNTFLQ